ncbi:MAG: metalloregulator ArsR/SmtB family transcription factor [Nitrincola lacisaponensis]|uniref:Arsenical resistance operon repressor n=1 Tax=Nitrincola lacisaponensis TaxID=267850 RepID=A0A063YAD9_9GAMM|nr:metalloregulator ArsR/SmtB family transcription factor [Nitrincola lacisaponensis]KDE41292.1 Arsenical resistance operon repressor [Nitrincola lacisaponensis]
MEAVVFFKCLSDTTRLRIITLLHHRGELCVCELMTALQESQPKISRHLAQLRNCGLLKDQRRGQWVYYSINPELPPWTANALSAACHASDTQLKADVDNLNGQQEDLCTRVTDA